jgi:hypothetical protein
MSAQLGTGVVRDLIMERTVRNAFAGGKVGVIAARCVVREL